MRGTDSAGDVQDDCERGEGPLFALTMLQKPMVSRRMQAAWIETTYGICPAAGDALGAEGNRRGAAIFVPVREPLGGDEVRPRLQSSREPPDTTRRWRGRPRRGSDSGSLRDLPKSFDIERMMCDLFEVKVEAVGTGGTGEAGACSAFC